MDYSKVNLHFLRIYARDIGVKSPNSCKKDVLIKKIKQIENGEVKPFFSKKGRPMSKKLAYKTERNEKEKQICLFIIDKVRKFLDELEKEIEDKF